MGRLSVRQSRVIDAPAETLYDILTDYHVGHPAILPPDYFEGLEVLEGGRGAGTLVRVRMKVLGSRHEFQMRTTEPDPGRVLVERDESADVTTRFEVEPLGPARARVTIATDAAASPGLRGVMERLLNPPITRRIYREELDRLADYARDRAARASA